MTKSMWKPIKESIKNSNEWLFWFTFLWTIVHIALFWIEFIVNGKFRVEHEMTIIYLGFLSTYVTTKEIAKWCGELTHIERVGELFIYIWGLTAFLMFMVKFFRPELILPSELLRVVLGALAIFVTSRISKTIRSKYNSKK